MGLEATVVCIDNSEWMRNGDFIPTRLQSQQDAVNTVCHMKTRQNVENTVGLLSMADTQVHVTLTNDTNKIFKALQSLEPKGAMKFITGLRIAHLALKHRQNRNQKTKIILFVGSPIQDGERDMIRLAKRLKKEKVTVDIVSFGEEEENAQKLTTFIDTLNGKEGKDITSHLVTAHPGPLLSEVIMSSPIMAGEDGAPLAGMGQGFEFGIDPAEDPELAMALRVSMEEQRQRQEDEARRVQQESIQEGTSTQGEVVGGGEASGAMAQAESAELPYNPGMPSGGGVRDVSAMTEEEQLALALQMSMSGLMEGDMQPMETDGPATTDQVSIGYGEVIDDEDEDDEEGMDELMQNPEFLHSVLRSLPGVNPEEALQNLEQMKDQQQQKDNKKDEDKK